MNFFGDVCDKKGTTELILQGVKKRRLQEPLPDIPRSNNIEIPNSDIINQDDDTYQSIKDIKPAADSPYIEVAVSRSYIEKGSYSSPSSPDRRGSYVDKRSRTSTCDSSQDDILLDTSRDHHHQKQDEGYVDEVPHDPSGLYARVDKSRTFSYLKKLEPKSSDDDDDDMVWKDNDAYQPVSDFQHDTNNIRKISDSPYATVPFLPKGHHRTKDFNKYRTMPHNRSHSASQEPIESPSIQSLRHSLQEAQLSNHAQESTGLSKSQGSTGTDFSYFVLTKVCSCYSRTC